MGAFSTRFPFSASRSTSVTNIVSPLTTLLNRRELLQAAVASGAALACGAASFPATIIAAEPPVRPGKPHLKLSLAAYSFNRQLPREWTGESRASAKMTLEDFVHYCDELQLGATELTGYYFPKAVTTEYLLSLKELCFRLGLDISGTAIGNDFCLPEGPQREAQLKMARDWIDYAAVLGAPVIRIFAGKVPKGDSEEAALERCIAGIDESLEYAAMKGVALALENHGGITATPEQMLRIVKAVKPSPWFGVNFDSGNFRTADPYGDLEQIAPYAINAQIKVVVSPNGGRKEEADYERLIAILKDAGYRGYVALEYEEPDDPKGEIPKHLDRLRALIG
jgi:sugar phosphate isomerase/epimerase